MKQQSTTGGTRGALSLARLLDKAGHLTRTALIPLVESDDWRGAPGKLLIAWVTTMILMPIAQWIIGDPSLIAGVILSVILQCAVSVALLNRAAGWRRTLLIGATVAIMGWAAEALGSHTGIPFGAYHYTERLQPQLLGVPLLIPLAWLMMLPPAWAVAQRLTGKTRGWRFVLVSALAFTVWDLFLDPQMVLWGLWAWDQPGQYFGIPLANYLGWFIVAALITAVARPPALRVQPLLVVYTLTWLIESLGLTLFWGLYGPALCGFIGMGVFVVAAWRAEKRPGAVWLSSGP